MDDLAIRDILQSLGCTGVTVSSFPLPRWPFGRIFRYNEFVGVGRRSAESR